MRACDRSGVLTFHTHRPNYITCTTRRKRLRSCPARVWTLTLLLICNIASDPCRKQGSERLPAQQHPREIRWSSLRSLARNNGGEHRRLRWVPSRIKLFDQLLERFKFRCGTRGILFSTHSRLTPYDMTKVQGHVSPTNSTRERRLADVGNVHLPPQPMSPECVYQKYVHCS